MHPYRAVVFDLGGVLAQITHTWQGAADAAGIATSFDSREPIPLTHFPPLDAYQMGALDEASYLQELASWAGCTADEAGLIHNGILLGEYPGVLDLVCELQASGVLTGCLSNTNALHWTALTGDRFPAIARLERKMASHLVGMNKPDPGIYRLYAETNGLRPDEITFFDDHPANVEAALLVGFRACRVDPAGDTAAQMRGYLAR